MDDALAEGPVDEEVRKVLDFLLNRPWWELVLRGTMILVFGIMAMIHPDLTVEVLIMLFGTLVLIEGIFHMVGSFAAKAENPQWSLMFISGLTSLFVGVLVLGWPGMDELVLLYFIGAWFLISGTVQLVFGLRAIGAGTRAGVHIAGGALGTAIGMMAFLWPDATAMSMIYVIGLLVVLFGIQLIVLGLLGRSQGTSTSALEMA
jgi:uncharacterized membrane protein HdeD (DUF308 family)